jgi:hypothetical protein
MGRLNPTLAALSAAFAITAVCSVGYHILATRSILLGMASAVGLPYALVLTTYLILHFAFEFDPQLSAREAVTLAVVASMAYSVFSLWLSRRQFLKLELRDTVSSRAAEVPAALVPKGLSALFRSRPIGAIPNLVRKEVCLHKPIFLVSAVLSAVWLLTLLFMLLRPAWHDNCVAVFNGLTGTQVVLMLILGGCVALGDDKALGTGAWHLTLPVSTHQQWLVKLLTAFGTTFAMAVILPTLLATLTLFEAKVGLLAVHPNDLLTSALQFAAVFVISFWSASMSANTVRGAITGILAFAGIVVLAGLGASLSKLLLPWPLQSGLVATVLAPYSVLLVSVTAAFVALHQSYLMFRHGQAPRSRRIKYAILLAMLIVLGSFWCADLNRAFFIHAQQSSHL